MNDENRVSFSSIQYSEKFLKKLRIPFDFYRIVYYYRGETKINTEFCILCDSDNNTEFCICQQKNEKIRLKFQQDPYGGAESDENDGVEVLDLGCPAGQNQ